MNTLLKKRIVKAAAILLPLFCVLLIYEIYIPKSLVVKESTMYEARRGMGDENIGKELASKGIIKNSFFFRLYVVMSGQHGTLQAGLYEVSSNMSVATLVRKMTTGDVAKQKITVLEGWDAQDIAIYLASKNIGTKEEFLELIKNDYSEEFAFLKSKPKDVTLEGYIFPDTYHIPLGTTPEGVLKVMLSNFGRVLTPELQQEITKQKKSIFQIVTMASILEKEVKSLEDRKMVSGILWKRIDAGVALQVDSTVNYATGNSYSRSPLKDLQVDSPYNTYKYAGLPKGPISNPGAESIVAAIYPTANPYWYFLTAYGTGTTIYSKTFQEHTAAIAKYLD